jgi:O-antigen/teichoic acid export membrane protein
MIALATILERTLCMPMTPLLARFVSERDYVGLRYTDRKAIYLLALAVLLVAVCVLFLKPNFIDVVTVILQLGGEDAASLWVLRILLLGCLYVAASEGMALAVCAAIGNTKISVKVGIYGFVVGLFFKAIVFIFFQIRGFVLATTVYYLLNMLMNWVLLEKQIALEIAKESNL